MSAKDYMNKKSTAERIAALMEEMTIEEKIGQLHQMGPSIVGGFNLSLEDMVGMMLDGRISKEEFDEMMANSHEDFYEDEIRAGRIGAYLGTFGAEKLNAAQKVAVEESRLGIPLLFGYDTIHGHRTIFPIPLGEACTWNPQLWQESARIAATEASATGVQWVFAPMVDIARDARWGRVSESAGEDTFLTSTYAKAKVKGFQGDSLKNKDSVLACPKHFVAYGGCEAGRDYNTVDISMQTLHEVYLPPFEAAVSAGAEVIMPAFNDVSGVPCTANSYLLRDVLREQFGFEGFTVSDANAVVELINHGVAADRKDAARVALSAGICMDMGTKCYQDYIAELIQEGSLTMQELDEAVERILQVKFDKGLFDEPFITDAQREKTDLLRPEFRAKAREIAAKSIVLLKNENQLLPLRKDAKIAVVGALADSRPDMIGAWAMSGRNEDCVTAIAGIRAAAPQVTYAPCCGTDGDFNREETDTAIAEAEIIVAVVGELADHSGEASSRADITLPGKQQAFVDYLLASGKPVVCVLMNGRPLAIPSIAEKVPAILDIWQLGIEGGNALADVLFGAVNPSGKLTTSFPAFTGQCPHYYNEPTTGRPGGSFKFTSRYLDAPLKSVFPFGHGLSYTTFAYSDLAAVVEKGQVKVSVTVTNTGSREGTETVQVYFRDVVASRIRPKKSLKGFRQITLAPGERRCVTITVPVAELGYYDNRMEYIVEPGTFRVMAGTSSEEYLETEICL